MNPYPTLLETLSGHFERQRHKHGAELHQQFSWVWGQLMHYPDSYAPFTPQEVELNRLILDRKQERRGSAWFHGGVAGLQPKDTLLPESLTGPCPPPRKLTPRAHQRLLFVTPCARFAGVSGRTARGTLYEVQPDCSLSVAPYYVRALRMFEDWVGKQEARESLMSYASIEFTCQSATVLSVLKNWS